MDPRKMFALWMGVMRGPEDEGAGGGGEADVGDAQAEEATPSEGEGDAGEGESVEGEEGAAEAENPAPQKQTPWFQRRIDELTKARREAERALEAQNKEVELLRATLARETDPEVRKQIGAELTEAQIEEKARQLAAQQAEVTAFNNACNAVYEQGVSTHADFKEVLGNYTSLGGLSQEFLSAALETEAPHEVIYALGKDLDEAARIMELPPLKKAVAMERLAAKLKKPAPVSKAPAPIKPVGGNKGGSTPDPEKMSTKEWMAWREKELKAKRA